MNLSTEEELTSVSEFFSSQPEKTEDRELVANAKERKVFSSYKFMLFYLQEQFLGASSLATAPKSATRRTG